MDHRTGFFAPIALLSVLLVPIGDTFAAPVTDNSQNPNSVEAYRERLRSSSNTEDSHGLPSSEIQFEQQKHAERLYQQQVEEWRRKNRTPPPSGFETIPDENTVQPLGGQPFHSDRLKKKGEDKLRAEVARLDSPSGEPEHEQLGFFGRILRTLTSFWNWIKSFFT